MRRPTLSKMKDCPMVPFGIALILLINSQVFIIIVIIILIGLFD